MVHTHTPRPHTHIYIYYTLKIYLVSLPEGGVVPLDLPLRLARLRRDLLQHRRLVWIGGVGVGGLEGGLGVGNGCCGWVQEGLGWVYVNVTRHHDPRGRSTNADHHHHNNNHPTTRLVLPPVLLQRVDQGPQVLAAPVLESLVPQPLPLRLRLFFGGGVEMVGVF